jgi:hypothetical protein
MATSAKRMRAHRQRARRGLKRLTVTVRDLEVRSDMRRVAVIYGFKLLGIVHVAH